MVSRPPPAPGRTLDPEDTRPTVGRGRRTRPSVRDPWWAGYVVGVLILSASLLATHAVRAYNSDDVAQQTILGQWGRGYQGDAHVGSDNFVLKLPLYLAVDAVMDNGRPALLLTALVLNLVGFTLFFVALRYFATRFAGRAPPYAVALLWFSSLGVFLCSMLMNPNVRNVEIGAAFVGLMLAAKYLSGEMAGSRTWIVLGIPATGLFLYNDPYFLYLAALPLLLFAGVWAVARRPDRRPVVLIGFLLAAAAAGELFDLVFTGFGFHTEDGRGSLASLADVGPHVRLLVEGTVALFNAEPLSLRISGSTVRSLLNAALVVLVVVHPVVLLGRGVRFRDEPWKWFFALYPLFVAAVFVFSDQPVDLASARYLVLLPFLAVLVIGTTLQGIRSDGLRRIAVALVAVAVLANLASTYRSFRRLPGDPNRSNQALVRAVAANRVSKGYADYWSANVNTYFSDDRIDFIQVTCDVSRVVPYLWLNDEAILEKPAGRSFFLFQEDHALPGCGESELARQFGPPAQVVPIDPKTRLLLYDYDLVQRMGRASSERAAPPG